MRIFGWGLAGALLLASTHADAGSGAAWWVDAGEACGGRRTALSREIMLACEAVGSTCHVATTRAQAELVALLDCASEDGPWTLETRTVEGVLLGRVALEGVGDDRLREAAVEIARDQAPELTLVAEALRDTMPASAAEHPPTTPPYPGPLLVFALAPRGSLMGKGVPTAGGSAMLGVELSGALFGTATFALEGGGTGIQQVRVGQGGLGLSYGAPFSKTSYLGTRFELGARGRQTYTGATTNYNLLKATDSYDGYGAATVCAQYPGAWIRPFAGLSLVVGDPFAGSAEVGVVVDLF
jgi:hypothetical protein